VTSEESRDENNGKEKALAATTNTETPFVPRLVEPDLYALPDTLKATYQPLGLLPSTLLTGVIGNLVLLWDTTIKSHKVRQFFHIFFTSGPLQSLTEVLLEMKRASWRTTMQWLQWTVSFVVKALVLKAFCTVVLQDLFLRPSRVSTAQLQSQYVLPSTLSKFREMPLSTSSSVKNATTLIGLHWLEYRATKDRNGHDNTTSTSNSSIDPETGRTKSILYCNHGFGASSLSWLPALKTLTHSLHCDIGLAHDALGFGFSEARSEDREEKEETELLHWYTWEGSAEIAQSLLHEQYSLQSNDTVVLMGHSMGALTTLYLALKLPKEIPKRIVLVAPALGVRPSRSRKSSPKKTLLPRRGRVVSFVKRARSVLLESPAKYVLRRTVGLPGFWKSGLKPVWGNAERLKDTDVLRFQWPSIHQGWEDGLIRFTKAVSGSSSHTSSMGDVCNKNDLLQGMPDEEALLRVLALPNTKVEVILGGKDRVVSPAQIRRFLKEFPQICVTELPGLGHDPFEEDVGSFVQALN
jgi:pimeloyl-ACP methyl ester carboxylesterase